MTRARKHRVAAFVLALLAATVGGVLATDYPEPLEVPEPRLDGFEPAVASQLAEARAGLVSAISKQVAVGELAEAFGSLGRLYDLYRLSESAEICWTNAASLVPEDYRWPYLLAIIQEREGRWQEVRRSLESVLELRPDDAPALIRLGRASLEGGRFDDARAYFERALAAPHARAAAHHGRGQVAVATRDPVAAIADFERALELQPGAGAIRYELGLAYRELGELERARVELGRAGSERVSFSDPLFESLTKAGAGAASQIVEGSMARSRGDLDGALRAFRRAVEISPETAAARLHLAETLMERGERQEAAIQLEQVLTSDPGNALALYNLGTLRAEAGDLERAEQLLTEAAEAAAEFAGAHRSLAAVLARLGRLEEAEARYASALSLNPLDVGARLERARTLVRLGRPGEAEAELREALGREPERHETLFALAELLEAGGRLDEARRVFEKLSSLGLAPPREGAIRFRLASILARMDEPDRAANELLSAVALVPENFEARMMLGRLLAGSERLLEAAEHFGVASRLRPDSEEPRFGEALSLMLAESYDAALARLEDGVQVLPHSLSLSHTLARLLAACPDARVRDGARALALARKVLEAQPRAQHAETVAMALAELRRFTDAIGLQAQIVEQMRRSGRPEEVERLQRVLERFKNGHPVRAPWLGSE